MQNPDNSKIETNDDLIVLAARHMDAKEAYNKLKKAYSDHSDKQPHTPIAIHDWSDWLAFSRRHKAWQATNDHLGGKAVKASVVLEATAKPLEDWLPLNVWFRFRYDNVSMAIRSTPSGINTHSSWVEIAGL